MTDPQSDNSPPAALHFNLRALLMREWSYFLMLILALFGVAYTSFSQAPITTYWIALAPFIGLICVINDWGNAESREGRFRLVWTQALHWGAVLLAMQLMFVADVRRMMNADASALAALTLLALGAFTAGIHIRAWRVCVVGIVLGVGVPAIAWLEQSALFLVLVIAVLAAVIVPLFLHYKRTGKKGATPASA